jgi:Fe-Mn family superoxide dismutase
MFTLPALPYAYDALSPVVSDRTLQFHHDKHHAAYVNALNGFRADAADKDATLEAVIAESAGAADRRIFNNAAQAWNHAFFWISMTPKAEAPSGALAEAIKRDFGGHEELKTAFVNGGVGHFGSGWVWLAVDGQGKLSVPSTHDAANLLGEHGLTPLLVCDLWEHAYYLDHQNDRKGFLGAWFDKLANWSFAAEQLAAASGAGKAWTYPAPIAG